MYRLGIDIGSTTIKMALGEVQGDDVQSTKEVRILATDYRRHNAEPMKVGQEMIEGILKAVSDQHSAISVGIIFKPKKLMRWNTNGCRLRYLV